MAAMAMLPLAFFPAEDMALRWLLWMRRVLGQTPLPWLIYGTG
jgi:hypothetical protein